MYAGNKQRDAHADVAATARIAPGNSCTVFQRSTSGISVDIAHGGRPPMMRLNGGIGTRTTGRRMNHAYF